MPEYCSPLAIFSYNCLVMCLALQVYYYACFTMDAKHRVWCGAIVVTILQTNTYVTVKYEQLIDFRLIISIH